MRDDVDRTGREVEVLAIGAGPANLALAVALEELAPEVADDSLIVEQHENVMWQRGMLLPWTQSQVSFLKDLVTLRNPRSRFSFLNFLHDRGRLDDFINLGSFTPYRAEISAYLEWVAGQLKRVPIEYNRRCTGIAPVRDGGQITHWRVSFADGAGIQARNLVVGVGRDPYVPPEFAGIPHERLIHSTEYSQRIAGLPATGAHRIAVIGGAQSAAEMAWAAHQSFPDAACTVIMRSIGMTGYESSKFTNELFYPSFVDEFFAAEPRAREQLLREMHRTNYAGLAPAMLDALYRQVYLEKLAGEQRLSMVTLTDVTGAAMHGDEVVLQLRDRRNGRVSTHACDVVLLGTGFVRGMPRLARELGAAAGLDQIAVDRFYRLRTPPEITAGCYLQGVNESTHGIADSLLSILARRSQEIVTDLLKHRAAAMAAPMAAVA